MKKHIIEEVSLHAIEFERIEKDGQVRYVACFQPQNPGIAKSRALKEFSLQVLDHLRALFLTCETIFLRDLPNPDYVEGATPHLAFSINQGQYKYYDENKSRFESTEPRHQLHYSFFHRYELSKGESVYVQRIPNEDLCHVTYVQDYFCNMINRLKKQPGFPSFSKTGSISSVQNTNGRFLVANFIKTEEDYQAWIKFLEKWHATNPKTLKKLGKDFFSPEHKGIMQAAVDQQFAEDKVFLHHFVDVSGTLASICDFQWNAGLSRYELAMHSQNKSELNESLSRLKETFTLYKFPCPI